MLLFQDISYHSYGAAQVSIYELHESRKKEEMENDEERKIKRGRGAEANK